MITVVTARKTDHKGSAKTSLGGKSDGATLSFHKVATQVKT